MMFESHYIDCLAGVGDGAKADATVGVSERIRNRKNIRKIKRRATTLAWSLPFRAKVVQVGRANAPCHLFCGDRMLGF